MVHWQKWDLEHGHWQICMRAMQTEPMLFIFLGKFFV